jgi:hypothetical protein
MEMEQDQLRRRVNEVAQYAEEAKRASYGNAVPAEVRECVDKMYWQARQAREACTTVPQQQQQQSAGAETVRSLVEELEQLSDRAVAACQASGNVDPPLQQAVKRAHEEVSRLKQQMQ